MAVLLVNFAISDGRTNYLEGFVMMMAYVCIALVCWYVLLFPLDRLSPISANPASRQFY